MTCGRGTKSRTRILTWPAKELRGSCSDALICKFGPEGQVGTETTACHSGDFCDQDCVVEISGDEFPLDDAVLAMAQVPPTPCE